MMVLALTTLALGLKNKLIGLLRPLKKRQETLLVFMKSRSKKMKPKERNENLFNAAGGSDMSNQITETLKIELNSGKAFEIEVTVTGVYDAHYGADADGNRGMGAWFLDDLEFELPEVDEEGVYLTTDETIELEEKLD